MDTIAYERKHSWVVLQVTFLRKAMFFDLLEEAVCVNGYMILSMRGFIYCELWGNRKMPRLEVAVQLNTISKTAFNYSLSFHI